MRKTRDKCLTLNPTITCHVKGNKSLKRTDSASIMVQVNSGQTPSRRSCSTHRCFTSCTWRRISCAVKFDERRCDIYIKQRITASTSATREENSFTKIHCDDEDSRLTAQGRRIIWVIERSCQEQLWIEQNKWSSFEEMIWDTLIRRWEELTLWHRLNY